jgi:hypothetical protein
VIRLAGIANPRAGHVETTLVLGSMSPGAKLPRASTGIGEGGALSQSPQTRSVRGQAENPGIALEIDSEALAALCFRRVADDVDARDAGDTGGFQGVARVIALK